MHLILLKKDIQIDIISEREVSECQTAADVLNKVKVFHATKDHTFDNTEFYDYIRHHNIKLGHGDRHQSFPKVLIDTFDVYDFMSDYFILKKENYYAFVKKNQLELL